MPKPHAIIVHGIGRLNPGMLRGLSRPFKRNSADMFVKSSGQTMTMLAVYCNKKLHTIDIIYNILYDLIDSTSPAQGGACSPQAKPKE